MSPNSVKVQDSLRDSLHMGQYANNKEGLQERLTVRHLDEMKKKYMYCQIPSYATTHSFLGNVVSRSLLFIICLQADAIVKS